MVKRQKKEVTDSNATNAVITQEQIDSALFTFKRNLKKLKKEAKKIPKEKRVKFTVSFQE